MESIGYLLLVLFYVGSQTTSANHFILYPCDSRRVNHALDFILYPCDSRRVNHALDICDSFVCHNDGKCRVEQVHHQQLVYCECKHGLHGRRCGYKNCHAFPCHNGGTCYSHWVLDEYLDFYCSCAPGYTGRHCETDIGPCSYNPCGDHGTCTATENNSNYTCSCLQGYQGTQCQQNLCSAPAHTDLCGKGTCAMQDTKPYYKCNCSKGYFGLHCEHAVCDIHPCNNGSCHSLHTMPYFTCQCADGFSGNLCEVSLMTTSKSAITTSATATLTPEFRTCDKYSTLSDVVDGVPVENNMTMCHSGTHTSPEAFVINNCNVTSSYASWKKGSQVMDACRLGVALPTYTPVGIFVNGTYVDALHGGKSGVFFGCLADGGFKFGVQDCDSIPLIEHINGTYFTMDPSVYFAII